MPAHVAEPGLGVNVEVQILGNPDLALPHHLVLLRTPFP
jgi:hypothetical protein